MFTHAIPTGRRRTLDRQKKQLFCDTVARGATMTEAAVALGVSLRTVQREARRDPAFDEELRACHHAPSADPLTLMKSHARRHWRASAWLLERQRPEEYGRRPASSCSAYQFEQELQTVLEAALESAAPADRTAVFAHVKAACEAAFKRTFPHCGPYGRRFVPEPPPTPLADAENKRSIRCIPDEFPATSAVLRDDPEALERASSRVGALHPPSPLPAPGSHHADPFEAPPAKVGASTHPTPDFTPRVSHRYALRAAATLNQLDPAALAKRAFTERFLSLLSCPTQHDTPGDKSPPPAPHGAPEPNPLE